MTPSRWSRGPEPEAPPHIKQAYGSMPEMECIDWRERIWKALRYFDLHQQFAHVKERNLKVQLRYLNWLTGQRNT